ncbi:MAG: hypothetical protein ACOVP4_01175 [Bacteriovoracaceae bacterium]|jgi:hypothetical protein
MKKMISLIILLLSQLAWGIDNPYLLRSPRGLLMGDAFTAVNDDEFTLFYNPASLGRHRRDLTMYPFNPTFSATNVLSDMDRFEDFPDTPQGAAEVLMDYPVHAGASIAPGFKLFNVGVTFLASEQIDAVLKNQTRPMLDVDLRQDRGVMVGFAIPLSLNRLSKKSFSGSQTSLGVGAKYIERKGISDTYALTGPTVLDTLGQDEVNDILRSLGTVRGTAWGFDAGIEHIVRSGPSQFVFGLAALDITDTTFKTEETEDKRKVADMRSQFNLGMSFGQDYKVFHYILSADVRALNEQQDFMRRVRVGAEVGFGLFSLMAGMNSGYYSYGASVNLGFIKVTAGFYDLEIGTSYKQTKSRQGLLYLSLFDFSFDA